jgi:hypothetical protein
MASRVDRGSDMTAEGKAPQPFFTRVPLIFVPKAAVLSLGNCSGSGASRGIG